MKKYVANTAVSLSVSLPGGGYTRVSFSALTDGSSVYYTNDKEIQTALEHHYKFGKLFRLAEDTAEQETEPKKPGKTQAKKTGGREKKKPDNDGSEEEYAGEAEMKEEPEFKEVGVTDLDAAKDYLAENYDVVRTKLKTEEIINETALSYGVVFKYL